MTDEPQCPRCKERWSTGLLSCKHCGFDLLLDADDVPAIVVPPFQAAAETPAAAGSVPAAAPDPLTLGDYTLGPLLGKGARGEVYRATSKSHGSAHAIRILDKQVAADPDWVARCKAEANQQKDLLHEHIVRVNGPMTVAGVEAVVMELVEGMTLEQLAGRPVGVERCKQILGPVLEALRYAHDRGVVHGDLKPSDIFLHHVGVKVTVKVADFGRTRLAPVTGATSAGTNEYRAPEVRRGTTPDARSDVYAVGAILYHLATGQPPNELDGAPRIDGMLAADRPRPPPSRDINPAMSLALDAVIWKAMETSPHQRYQTAEAFRIALEQVHEELLGRYRLEDVLEPGGMSTVYRGTDLTLPRTVAVKVCRNPEHFPLMEREAGILAQLDHPGVVRILDKLRTETSMAIVMPLLPGRNLGAVVAEITRDENRRPSPVRALAWFRPLLQALAYVHGKGIVHRDLKPANVVVLGERGTESVVLVDFGVAVQPEGGPRLTRFGDATAERGTHGYMAPEQRAHPYLANALADIYSIGVMLYEVLNGELPQIVAPGGDAAKATSKVAEVGEELEHVIQRAVAMSPADRFQSATMLLEALEDGVAKCPVVPTPPTPRLIPAPARRWSWHSFGVGAGVAVISLVGGYVLVGAAAEEAGGSTKVVTTTHADATTSLPAPLKATAIDAAEPTGLHGLIPADAGSAIDAIEDANPFVVCGRRRIQDRAVTRAAYAKYLTGAPDTDHPLEDWKIPLDRPAEPVTWVTHEQATNFCAALGAFLPDGEEWDACVRAAGREEGPRWEWTDTKDSETTRGIRSLTRGTSAKFTAKRAPPGSGVENIAASDLGFRCVR